MQSTMRNRAGVIKLYFNRNQIWTSQNRILIDQDIGTKDIKKLLLQ